MSVLGGNSTTEVLNVPKQQFQRGEFLLPVSLQVLCGGEGGGGLFHDVNCVQVSVVSRGNDISSSNIKSCYVTDLYLQCYSVKPQR